MFMSSILYHTFSNPFHPRHGPENDGYLDSIPDTNPIDIHIQEEGMPSTQAQVGEHHTKDDEEMYDDDDIRPDLEVDDSADNVVQDEDHAVDDDGYTPQPTGPRRSIPLSTFSTFMSFSSMSIHREPPAWFLKFKNFIHPKTSVQDIDSYVPNYRYTPIISGIVIPFSILLEIPGLTERWYIRTENNQTIEVRKNTLILDVGLALSMACALAANICLVLRFLEIKIKPMTLYCVLLLTIHDIINTVAVTTFGVEHRFDDGFTYGQSFWITVCSTIASSVTNFTLIWDFIRTPDFANSGSGLTRKQRSLVIMVIVLLCYIAFGALVHTFLLHLSFIDALYFTVVSIETIGFGDFHPDTTGSRLFTCTYSAIGIINLALAVGMTRETVLEGLEVGYRKRLQIVRARRKAIRRQRRVEVQWREAVEWRLKDQGSRLWVKDDPKPRSLFQSFLDKVWPWPTGEGRHYGYGRRKGMDVGYGHHPHGMHLNLEALTDAQLEAAAFEAGKPLETLLPPGFKRRAVIPTNPGLSPNLGWAERGGEPYRAKAESDAEGIPLTHGRLGKMIRMLGQFAIAMHHTGHSEDNSAAQTPVTPSVTDIPQLKRALTQDDDHLQTMEHEERKASYARMSVAWFLFLVFWTIGSAIFMRVEGWSYGTAMYFCFVAFSTIGYGDYSPQTPAGRTIFVAWALLGVGTMTILISVMTEAYSNRYKNALHTGTWDKAVKRYRARSRAFTERAFAQRQKIQPHLNINPVSNAIQNTVSIAPTLPGPNHSTNNDVKPLFTFGPEFHPSHNALSVAQDRVEQHLEALPHHILKHARAFHEHVQYFTSPARIKRGSEAKEKEEAIPDSLKKLMDDITGTEKLGLRIKEEILGDADARHTLFTLSIERALRRMVDVAEQALNAIDERNRISEMHQAQQQTQGQVQNQGQRSEVSSSEETAVERTGGLSNLKEVPEVDEEDSDDEEDEREGDLALANIHGEQDGVV